MWLIGTLADVGTTAAERDDVSCEGSVTLSVTLWSRLGARSSPFSVRGRGIHIRRSLKPPRGGAALIFYPAIRGGLVDGLQALCGGIQMTLRVCQPESRPSIR